jgi:hypothetical protein
MKVFKASHLYTHPLTSHTHTHHERNDVTLFKHVFNKVTFFLAYFNCYVEYAQNRNRRKKK